jgi:glycosyltransferase involved in cell wall biosynthesis
MAVYNVLLDPHEPLYDAARTSCGVAYHGSVAQPVLAQALRRATMLAYPNIFAETSCIAMMEAMAAGCAVVTSDLGALPETGAGFIDLTPPLADADAHAEAFADRVIQLLAARQADPAGTEARMQAQVAYVVPRTTGRDGPSSGLPGCPAWPDASREHAVDIRAWRPMNDGAKKRRTPSRYNLPP